jgi:hypothetical protein
MQADFCNEARSRSVWVSCCRGLTTLEFVGCLAAVVGGAWIGAMYLGVNVEHVAHSALEQTNLLDKVPPEWRPEGPNVVTREQLLASLKHELGSLRSEIVALRSETNPAGAGEPLSDASAAGRESTRAYWRRLNEIALGEDDMQRDAEKAIDNTNAPKVFAIKARISRYAARGVEAVPSEGVDEQVVRFGRQLAIWYGRADELYEQAVTIWETPGNSQSRTQLSEAWKQTEIQHRQEARLLRERAAVLRASISRQLGEEFPDFAKPVAPVEPAPPAETNAQAG